jgi:hypothetical protein
VYILLKKDHCYILETKDIGLKIASSFRQL